jgi:alkylhydroperoxidase family enzyme
LITVAAEMRDERERNGNPQALRRARTDECAAAHARAISGSTAAATGENLQNGLASFRHPLALAIAASSDTCDSCTSVTSSTSSSTA